MTKQRIYDHTKSGRPIADEEVHKLAAEAEAGYDVDQPIARRASAAAQRSVTRRPASNPCD